MKNEIIRISELSHNYISRGKRVTALDQVSLTVNQGELVLLEGPSGSGKTTLLLCAGALLQPDKGTVFLQNTDMYGSSPHWRNKARAEVMGFVFQQFQLIPYLTVYENIALPSVAKPIVNEKSKTDALIRRFGLEKRAHHFSEALSTGERQRVAMARAFFNNPKLILADEPTGNLDDLNAKTVLDYLKEFVEQGGAALLVTHDSRAAEYADKKYRIMNGIME